jgi:hypothetical protein
VLVSNVSNAGNTAQIGNSAQISIKDPARAAWPFCRT